MQILSYVIGLAGLVFWIMTLVQMFKRAGVLQGILGIICALWAFIWGWMHVGETGQKSMMTIWTILIVVNIVLTGMTGGFSPSGY